MDYYNEIKERLLQSEIYDKAKDYAKDRNKVITYYEIGKLLSDAGKEYGKNIINQYSEKLMLEVGKKYNERTLRRIRQFYDVFKMVHDVDRINNDIITSKLTWSHYREVLPLKDINAIKYYLNISESKNLTVKQLQEKIRSHEYERLPDETKHKLIVKEKLAFADNLKYPIMIKNTSHLTDINHKMLSDLIMENIEKFLLQLGEGFTFIKREYRIKIGDRYNYIDILLFNYIYNCFVVVELKTTEFSKYDIGQIQLYMNYINSNLKKDIHNLTVGIIIAKKDNHYVMEYCSDERIFSTTYVLI